MVVRLRKKTRTVEISMPKDFQETKGADGDLTSVSCGVLHVIVLSKISRSKMGFDGKLRLCSVQCLPITRLSKICGF